MHELSIMNNVLQLALRVADENNGKEVRVIELEAGVMSGVVEKYAQSFFKLLSQGTIAEHAQLKFTAIPAHFICKKCGENLIIYEPGTEFYCENCGSEKLKLTSGMGFRMTGITII